MAEPVDRDALRAWLEEEYARPFVGWDFSYLAGRRVTRRPADTWDFAAAVAAVARTAPSMLDMDTGGGERLATLSHRPPRTVATEGYPPNLSVARQRLAPLGVPVVGVPGDAPLPFVAGAFALVINHHGAYDPAEVRRVLTPGGHFITQQVGWQTNRRLHELLDEHPTPPGWNPGSGRGAGWELAPAVADLEAAGFTILEQREQFPVTRYTDVGAVVYYLKAVAWEIPDFAVERYFERLVAMHQLIQREGGLDVGFHHFFIRAQRPAGNPDGADDTGARTQ